MVSISWCLDTYFGDLCTSLFFAMANSFGMLSRGEKIIQYLAFRVVLDLNSFGQYFFKVWPLIYLTWNKHCLETWSCVCGYCAYGLFLALVLALNYVKKRQEIGGGSHGISVRRQWVNVHVHCTLTCSIIFLVPVIRAFAKSDLASLICKSKSSLFVAIC